MYYFVHIEKCAGTTLHEILSLTFFRYWHITKNNFGGNEKRNDLTLKEFNQIRRFFPSIIGGHNVRPYLNFIEPSKCFTFLRNPIDRYISQFNHDYERGFSKDFDFFLNREYTQNFMVQKIAGSQDLSKAIKILEQFFFIGDVDNFDQSLYILSKKFNKRFYGSSIKKNVRNIKENYLTLENLNIDQIEKMYKNNNLDIQLYKMFIENSKFKTEFESYNFKKPSKIHSKIVRKINKVKKKKITEIRSLIQ